MPFACRSFRSKWSSSSAAGGSPTTWSLTCLDMLQPLAEIEEALQLLTPQQGSTATADDIRKLTSIWISRSLAAAGGTSGGVLLGGGGIGAEGVLEVLGVRRAVLESCLNQQLAAGHMAQVSVRKHACKPLSTCSQIANLT